MSSWLEWAKHPYRGSAAEPCGKCGALVRVGDWPFCPHGEATHFGDDPIEPYVDEHLAPEPVEITTRAQRRRIMSRNSLDYLDVSGKKRGRVYVDMHRR